MADSSESRPVARATKPVSEALLNEKVSEAVFIGELSNNVRPQRQKALKCELNPWLMGSNSYFDGRGRSRRDIG